MTMMTDARDAVDSPVEVKDIAELVAERLPGSPACASGQDFFSLPVVESSVVAFRPDGRSHDLDFEVGF